MDALKLRNLMDARATDKKSEGGRMSPRTALAVIAVITFVIVWSITSVARSQSASADVYPRWASLDDYQARVLTADTGLTNPICTSGVIWLGVDRYKVPAGVEEFWCREGK